MIIHNLILFVTERPGCLRSLPKDKLLGSEPLPNVFNPFLKWPNESWFSFFFLSTSYFYFLSWDLFTLPHFHPLYSLFFAYFWLTDIWFFFLPSSLQFLSSEVYFSVWSHFYIKWKRMIACVGLTNFIIDVPYFPSN